MNQLRTLWQRFFPPVQPIPAGLYPYQTTVDAPFPYRLHLRIDQDGQGILIVNASTVLHLNPTAAEIAYHMVRNTDEDTAVQEIARRYDAPKEVIKRDYYELVDRLKTMINTPDLDPVSYLSFEREIPYSATQSAPYRIDCALTYHLQDEDAQILAPLNRVERELLTDEWKEILTKAWNAGVPHVVFTGGEPTLRPDLVELIAFAEKLGMVSGVITDGHRLGDPQFLHNLLQSGLDHIMILIDPGEEDFWEGLRDALAEDIAVTAHLTLTERNLAQFDATLERLVGMGLQNISLSAMSAGDNEKLQEKRQLVAEHHLRLVWDLPTPYSRFHPVALELAEETKDAGVVMDGAGKAWIYVEPDGDVLRGQGRYHEVLGNLTKEPWESVWAAAKT